jgi:CSLREA domain-containing protein
MTNTRTQKINHYFRMLVTLAALLTVASLLATSVTRPAQAATTFTVTRIDDRADAKPGDGICSISTSGTFCTLRAAIQEANATPGPDTINFNINAGGKVATIKPSSQLPYITDQVTIDGYSQPGSSPNTLDQGTNAALKIELSGVNAGGYASGLHIQAGGSHSVVKGLVINRFAQHGVFAYHSDKSTIQGNFIGTDPSGTLTPGNSLDGVQLYNGESNVLGGHAPAERNLISGNGRDGISLRDYTHYDRILGNLVGTQKDGSTALGNSGDGVDMTISTDNLLYANTIAFSGGDGIHVDGFPAYGNIISNNFIFSNVEQGIDLAPNGVNANDGDSPYTPQNDSDSDTGPNGLQNYPVITSAKNLLWSTTMVKGTLNSTPNTGFTIEFFSNPSGGDEGQKYIGQSYVTTDASGNASFTFEPTAMVAPGQTITATATVNGGDYDTSEFSAPRTVDSIQSIPF